MRICEEEDRRGRYLVVECDGGQFWVDAADRQSICERVWRVRTLFAPHCTYVVSQSAGQTLLLHREIMNAPSGIMVDHRDGNGLLNRRHNLRLATAWQNASNRQNRSRGASGRRGVYKTGSKWTALIRVNYKLKYLGAFTDPDDAARAYDVAATAARGEFTDLNFPLDDGA